MRSILTAVLALTSPAVVSYAQAPAQPAPARVAVVTLQGAIVSTQDGKKALQELESKFAPKEKQIQQQRSEIQGLQDQLQKGSNTMSEQALSDLQRNIEDKTRRLNRDLQDAREEYERENQRLVQGVAQRMLAVVEKYAKDHGYTMVLDTSNPNTPILYRADEVDITKDVVALYDKSAPTASAPATPPPAATKPAQPTKPATPPLAK